jgi:arginase
MTTGTRVIYVPFNSAGVADGVAGMPAALQAAGIESRLPGPVVSSWMSTDTMAPIRGPSGLLTEDALAAVVADTAAAVEDAWRSREVPVVIAGDCPALLAPLIAAKTRGGAGLVFIDGHEDAWDPKVGPTGEAADSEIGLALGLFPGPASLAGLPCLRAEHLVVLGPRDQEEIANAGQVSIRLRVPRYLSGAQLARNANPGNDSEVADLVATGAATAPAGWWCHVDLDVLTTSELPAVDYPQPGGLSWDELELITAACLRVPGCLGASVVIYNPELDGGAAAARIAEYVAFVRAHIQES